METRPLGRTGLQVTVLGLGTGQFGSFGQTTEDDCARVAHCAFDGGINLIDTADFYSFGESERITGKVIAGRRDKLIVATKCGMPMSDDPNERGGSRRWITKSVEGSLKRLGTDWIDLYQLHQPDPSTDIEETVDAMNDLMRQGKIRAFGTSNFSAAQATEASYRARLAGLCAPHSEQQSYSIFRRQPEAELLPACERLGVGVLAYSPLDGGWLSGKYRRGAAAEASARQRLQPGRFDHAAEQNRAKLDAVEALAVLCEEAGVDMQHLAIGFVLAHPAVTTALIGGSKTSYIETHLKGREVILSDEVLDRIDAIVAPGFGLEPEAPASSLADPARRRRRQGLVKAAPSGLDFIRRTVMAEKPAAAS